MKEQQAREEATQQKEELERRMIEYQEEASRAKEALVNKPKYFNNSSLQWADLFVREIRTSKPNVSNPAPLLLIVKLRRTQYIQSNLIPRVGSQGSSGICHTAFFTLLKENHGNSILHKVLTRPGNVHSVHLSTLSFGQN